MRNLLTVVIILILVLPGQLTAAGGKRKASRESNPGVTAVDPRPAEENVAAQAAPPADESGAVEKAPGAGFEEEDFRPQVEEESTIWMIFKTLFILGLMVGGFYYFFRFVTKKAGIQFTGQDVIQVLSIVPVGQNRYLQVVDLAGRILVLGVAENNISLLLEITDRDEKERIRLMSSRSRPDRETSFSDYMTRQIGRVTDFIQEKRGMRRQSSSLSDRFPESGADLDYLKQQKSRLKNLDGWRDE